MPLCGRPFPTTQQVVDNSIAIQQHSVISSRQFFVATRPILILSLLNTSSANLEEEEEEDDERGEEEAAPAVGPIGPELQAILTALGMAADRMVTALEQAAQVAGAVIGGGAPPPPTAGANPFIRTPLQANTGQVLDLYAKEGRKYFKSATRSLFPSDEKFDVEPNNFQLFIQLLANRYKDLARQQRTALPCSRKTSQH